MLGSALSFVLVLGVFVLIVAGIIASAISGALGDLEGGKTTKVKENTVLKLELNGPIVDRGRDKANDFSFGPFQNISGIGLDHFVADLEKAAGDENIEGILIEAGSVMASPATLTDMREAIVDFKSSGKWVVAYSEVYSQSAYYLASAADEVYLYPEGGMDLSGLATEIAFFKNMLDRLGVEVQVLRGPNNKYKSAVEGFIREDMSEPNREQVATFLNDIWEVMVNDMASSRGLTADQINLMADSLMIRLPADAVKHGLVDDLKYRDEVMAMLLDRSGVELDDEEDEEEKEAEEGEEADQEELPASVASARKSAEDQMRFVSLGDYHSVKAKKADSEEEEEKEDKKKKTREWKKDRVAVIYAIGAIESGEGDDETIGSERIVKALRDARTDDKVKAVVLRVNSPGGSALASDVIWRETMLLKEAGKPFIVSMGDVAASGGYYIAAGADKIVAHPTTITGSIGVFGLLPNAEGMFNDKLGITFDQVTTNEHGNFMTITRPLDDFEFEAINESVTSIYNTFLKVVSEGRNMSVEEVDSVAQGRVWTGLRAHQVGLVDELGDLDYAIELAAEMAELEDYTTRDLPELIDPMKELMKQLEGEAQTENYLRALGVSDRYLSPVKEAKGMLESGDHVQARLPYHLIWN